MKALLPPVLFSVLALSAASAGTFSLSSPFTDDTSTGIDPLNDYTHAISGGTRGGTIASVNGVTFERLSPGVIPPNFTWQTSTGNFSEVNNNPGTWWVPSDGGVTGTGLIDLLNSFTYHGDGAQAGSNQTFTLSGLTPGVPYQTRLFQRVWDEATSGRPIDLTFTNGAEVDVYPTLFEQDRPGNVLGTGNQDQVYSIDYDFVAQGTTLIINAAVPPNAVFNSGSYHMYGLTNQVIPEPGTAALFALAMGLAGLVRRRR